MSLGGPIAINHRQLLSMFVGEAGLGHGCRLPSFRSAEPARSVGHIGDSIFRENALIDSVSARAWVVPDAVCQIVLETVGVEVDVVGL
jgi:hypothetical protein